ncbi:hypothetical protein HDU82_009235 [Entophlyctis luteolus]|nr:hypothetical protein HDU82_009235 [Entophlyctis luteolus]
MTSTIRYTLPASRLDHDEAIYLTYDPKQQRPAEEVPVELRDVRGELDSHVPVSQQLAQRGFAVSRHVSDHVAHLDTAEGARQYMNEAAEVLRVALGCTRVIPWNSVSRKSDPAVTLKFVKQQTGPEENHVPGERVQPVAIVAHVDQDEVWGKELCARAVKAPINQFKRVQIVNIWRPLTDFVANSPLAMLDFKKIAPEDLSKHASMFGVGMDLHYSANHEWNYLRHQTPGEIIFLKCYDSWQGTDGSALYCGHVAATLDDSAGLAPEFVVPRESIEVRLVAVWE